MTNPSSRKSLLAVGAAVSLIAAGAGCNQQTEVQVQTPSTSTDTNSNGSMNMDHGSMDMGGMMMGSSTVDGSMMASSTMDMGGMMASGTSMGSMMHSDYKDGTYTAEGSYTSPAGPEHIKISVTLKNDLIVDTTATPEATAMTSVRMQNMFASGYKAMVVGKDIDSVNLTKVSGSSLTPGGFNDAIAKIKLQAKS